MTRVDLVPFAPIEEVARVNRAAAAEWIDLDDSVSPITLHRQMAEDRLTFQHLLEESDFERPPLNHMIAHHPLPIGAEEVEFEP